MAKQLVFLWSFILFLAPAPAVGDYNSNCTVGDSPDGYLVTSVIPSCSNDSAAIEVIPRSDISDPDHVRINFRIDYVCIGNDGQKITGVPLTTNRHIPVTELAAGSPFIATVPESLDPGTNCTFYICYKQSVVRQPYRIFRKASPASCITDINECDESNDCHENAQCTNTVGSYTCSCNPGYTGDGVNCTNINECELETYPCNSNAICTDTNGSFNCTCEEGFEGDGFNCTDINECESNDLNNCHENAQCTNTEGSFNCSCNPGYTGDGVNCTNTNECELETYPCHSNASCTDTDGSFNCTCREGFEGDGLNCTDVDECNTTNGGCEHSCTNTVGSFICSCETGYQLDESGLNCIDVDECEGDDSNNCHENAQCTNTDGSYTCSCNPGYTGDGVNCTNINECESDDLNNCHENAQCINTEGSFTCSCNPGYTGDGVTCTNINECGLEICSSNANCTDTDGSFNCTCREGFQGDGLNCTVIPDLILPAMLVPMVVLTIIIVLLCVAICVVYYLRKEDTTMYEVHKMFIKDKIDLSYNPVSPFTKLATFPSITSVFDKLGTISDTETQTGDTDTSSRSEITAADPHNELMDILVNDNSTTSTVASPENNTTLESFVASTTDRGYFDSQAFQSTDVSMDIFLGTGNDVSNVSYPINLQIDEDARSDNTCEAQQSVSGHDCSDTPAASHISLPEPSSGSHSTTATCNSAGQNSGYIRSEDLLSDSHDLSHIVETESIHCVSLEETADPQLMVESEGYYIPAKEAQPSLPNTQLFASVEEKPDLHGLQNPKGLSTYIEVEDNFSITDTMSSSERYHASTYFDNTVQSHFNVQHLSTSSGYITDCY